MKRILATVALTLAPGVLFAGNAAGQPEATARPVNENACERTDPLWGEAPRDARPGLPHDQGHGHGCHHATGTDDPSPNP
jgi:hypothetical protein